MVVAQLARAPVRPACSRHPGSRVRLDGYVHSAWSEAHRRPRYRCVSEPRSRGHVFSLPIPVRQPTERHPDSGATCPRCEHIYERHEGVRTGRDFVFGHTEIARLFLRIGEGMSLRDASTELRRSIFRVGRPGRADAAGGHDWPDETSRRASLAVNYLDAFAPAVIAALHPRTWPAAIVIDSTTLMTRGYRKVATDVGDGGSPLGEAEQRVGNVKAGTILAALDPTGPVVVPCLIEAHGGKDIDSWKAFFGSLGGAPEWVVADLDPAIARAVRETWPGAILYHSRHHLAELMRRRAVADGVPERIELDEPIELARYAGLIRARFEATGQRSHLPGQNELPVETVAGQERQMSWWRTWHDRDEASLPRLVRESDLRTRRRAEDDHLRRLRARLTTLYTAETDARTEHGLPSPPRGRPKRPADRAVGSVSGKVVGDFPDLLAEWDWDVNGDLDPGTVAAGGRQRIVWRCCLNPDHVWETRVRSDDQAVVLPVPHGQPGPSGRVTGRLLPLARPAMASDQECAAPRPGHTGVGPRSRLVLQARSRVDGRRLCPDALAQRLPDLLSARNLRADQDRQEARSPDPRRTGRDPGGRSCAP